MPSKQNAKKRKTKEPLDEKIVKKRKETVDKSETQTNINVDINSIIKNILKEEFLNNDFKSVEPHFLELILRTISLTIKNSNLTAEDLNSEVDFAIAFKELPAVFQKVDENLIALQLPSMFGHTQKMAIKVSKNVLIQLYTFGAENHNELLEGSLLELEKIYEALLPESHDGSKKEEQKIILDKNHNTACFPAKSKFNGLIAFIYLTYILLRFLKQPQLQAEKAQQFEPPIPCHDMVEEEMEDEDDTEYQSERHHNRRQIKNAATKCYPFDMNITLRRVTEEQYVQLTTRNSFQQTSIFTKENRDQNIKDTEQKMHEEIAKNAEEPKDKLYKFQFEIDWLTLSCMTNDARTVQYLLNLRIIDTNGNFYNQNHLEIIAENGYLDLLKLLLEHSSYKTFANHDKLLSLAVKNGHIEIAKHLIKTYGIFPFYKNSEGKSYIILASLQNHKQMLEFLVEEFKFSYAEYPDLFVMEEDISVLHIASANNFIPLIDYFLNRGLNIDSLTKKGETPLLFALQYSNNIHTIEFLISRSADLNIKYANGNTIMHEAASLALENFDFALKMIALLLNRGCSLLDGSQKISPPIVKLFFSIIDSESSENLNRCKGFLKKRGMQDELMAFKELEKLEYLSNLSESENKIFTNSDCDEMKALMIKYSLTGSVWQDILSSAEKKSKLTKAREISPQTEQKNELDEQKNIGQIQIKEGEKAEEEEEEEDKIEMPINKDVLDFINTEFETLEHKTQLEKNLHQIVCFGSLDELKELLGTLQKNSDEMVSEPWSNVERCLKMAVFSGNIDIIDYLYDLLSFALTIQTQNEESVYNLNQHFESGETLPQTIIKNHIIIENVRGVFKWLIDKDVDLIQKDMQGDTLLHLIIKYDAIDLFDLVIEKINILEENNEKKTPIHIAWEKKEENQFFDLIKNHAHQKLNTKAYKLCLNIKNLPSKSNVLNLSNILTRCGIFSTYCNYGQTPEVNYSVYLAHQTSKAKKTLTNFFQFKEIANETNLPVFAELEEEFGLTELAKPRGVA